MTDRSIEVRRVTLQISHLQALEEAERDLLVFTGHAINELNSLNKVFAWCLGAVSPESADGGNLTALAQGMQAMIYGRVLAGKLLETWRGLKVGLFGSSLSRTLESALLQPAAADLSELKRYFGRKNLIYDVRNGYAFHYSPKDLGRHLNQRLEPLDFVLGGTVGNNINIGCEFEANACVFSSASSAAQLEAGMEAFLEDVQIVHARMICVLEGCQIALLEKALNGNLSDHGKKEKVAVQERFSEVRIPWFCAT